MPWAPDDSQKLRERQKEVDDLRQEEQEHCLAAVTEDGCSGKSHPCEVAVGVADEDSRRESIVLHEGERSQEEGDHDAG